MDRYVDELKAGPPALPPATLADDGNPTRTNIIEGQYIHRVAANKPLEMARVHQCGVDIRVGGDIVELCDIYDVSKDLIHLKIWRSSQGFSALAMQAANAAELLVSDKTFLRDARRLLEGRGNQFRGILQDDFKPRDYRIVIGLIRKEAGEIPFFSRLTLMRAAERVTGKALRVAFVVILRPHPRRTSRGPGPPPGPGSAETADQRVRGMSVPGVCAGRRPSCRSRDAVRPAPAAAIRNAVNRAGCAT